MDSVLRVLYQSKLILITKISIIYFFFRHIINEINAPTLFATHYHELTELANKYTSVKNYHALVMQEADDIVLLYKILPGPCDRSFGIHAATLAGFPESIINVSNLYLILNILHLIIQFLILDGQIKGN